MIARDPDAVRRARRRAALISSIAAEDPLTAPISSARNRTSPAVQRAEALRRDPEQYFRDARRAVEREVANEVGVVKRRPRRAVVRASIASFAAAVVAFYLVPVGAALGWW